MTDRSSVADVVDRLVLNGYATRGWSSEDRRRAQIDITTAGQRLARSAPPAPTARLIGGLKGLSESELQRLAPGMNRLLAEMNLDEDPSALVFEPAGQRRSRNGHKPALRR